jgi:hypothetical protein
MRFSSTGSLRPPGGIIRGQEMVCIHAEGGQHLRIFRHAVVTVVGNIRVLAIRAGRLKMRKYPKLIYPFDPEKHHLRLNT